MYETNVAQASVVVIFDETVDLTTPMQIITYDVSMAWRISTVQNAAY